MKLVPCYPLSSVLSADQEKVVRPYLCATFMETWMRINQSHAAVEDGSGWCKQCAAREVIRLAAGHVFVDTVEREGRSIEGILYDCAKIRSIASVMAPPRESQ